MPIKIRKLNREDMESCIKLFQETIHSVNAKDYSPDQLEIWAPKNIDVENQWWQTLLENIALVAVMNDEIVGFIDITKSGYLDRLFVHKDYQGKGIASSLLQRIEELARQQLIYEVTTEASITAKPFFEARGFEVCNEQQKLFAGTQFTNFVMKKKF